MSKDASRDPARGRISRRNFLEVGAAAVAGSALTMCSGTPNSDEETAASGMIKQYRTLGRTGFEVADISMGCGAAEDPAVLRYAYDHGINYFDTAEGYVNGASETALGKALQHWDRKKVWITTKIVFEPEVTKEEILERFGRSQERLQTDYVDALFMHSVGTRDILDHQGFHAAVDELKTAGRLRHLGVSNHGPRDEEQDSMEEVLSKAAEDGRFDLMLLSYNFLNQEEAERVLALCKQHNVGTTAMKTSPGMLTVDPVDPDNLVEDYAEYVERVAESGVSREDAIERIRRWVARQEETIEQIRPFAEKHGLQNNEQLRTAGCQWALQNPDMQTICISVESFEDIDTFVGLSGTKLSTANRIFMDDFRLAHGNSYCRHACSVCAGSCVHDLPVSTIMRYCYYFTLQGRQKSSMQKYAALADKNGLQCLGCSAPCAGSCPHGIDIPANLLNAHSLLSLG